MVIFSVDLWNIKKKKNKSLQLQFPGLLKLHKRGTGIKNFMFGKKKW